MSSDPDWSRVREAVLVQSTERATLLRQVMILKICGWGVFTAICGVGLYVSSLRSDPEIFFATLFSALLVVVPIFMVIAAKHRRLQTDFYIAILPLLLPALDQWSIVTRKPARQIARMPGHYFVPRNKIDCDFHIEGSLGGVPFSVTQAVLIQSSGEDNGETTFRGLVLWTRVSSAFPGDFAALRRPPKERSLWRGTALPDRLRHVPNATRLGRWAYDFVSTDVETAKLRMNSMAAAIDTLLTLRLDDLSQVTVRGVDAFVLLPLPRFGWDADTPVPTFDVERDLRPFAAQLRGVLQAMDAVRKI
jgi:hypothetical protein